MKSLSLGSVASAAAGILITGGTNATPIVATIGAGHGLKNGDRIAITGVTGLTAMNGEWELTSVAATTVTLVGSVGNGTFGGTAAVAVLCDRTPTMRGHSAVVVLNEGATAFVGTVLVEGSDDNTTFADVKKGVALGANPGHLSVEVELKKYMRLRASAWTSGTMNAQIHA